MTRKSSIWKRVLATVLSVATAMAVLMVPSSTLTVKAADAAASAGYTLGIDVSKYNGTINWGAVASSSNIKFAIVKAGSTKSGQDPQFVNNITGAAKSGLSTGAYIYSYAMNVDQVKAEANQLIAWLAPYSINYPVVLDIEDKTQAGLDAATITAMCNAFGDIVSAAGYTPLIYTYKNFYKAHITQDMKYGLWIAQYNAGKCDVGSANLWQYTSNGAVAGISTRVDVNALLTGSFNAKRGNGWYTDGIGTRYRTEGGTDVIGDVCMIGGMDYYFNDKGYLLESTTYKIDGKMYVFDENGEMQINRFYTLNGVTYYCDVRGIASVWSTTPTQTPAPSSSATEDQAASTQG